MIQALALYPLAALAEIGGCFALWAVLRSGASPWWLLPGMAALAAFAWLLTLVGTEAAGRAYAAYGGVYVVASLAWLWLVEGRSPTGTDLAGAGLCLAGTAVILAGALRG